VIDQQLPMMVSPFHLGAAPRRTIESPMVPPPAG
jgi:hypothetical protein